jgi:hypothetical protein
VVVGAFGFHASTLCSHAEKESSSGTVIWFGRGQ